MNHLAVENPHVTQFISTHFDVAFQNVSQLEDAEVILLGETHGDRFHDDANMGLINRIYRSSDIVLTESPYDEVVPDFLKLKNISGITARGWDDGAIRRIDSVVFPEHFVEIRKRIKEIGEMDLMDPLWIDKIRELIKLYPQKREWEEDYFLNETEKDFAAFSPDERALVAHRVIRSVIVEWMDFIFYYIPDTIAERNACMVNQITDACFPGRKVFVIAGRGHLVDRRDKNSAVFHDLANRGIPVLHQGLQGKKYVILTPKKNESENSYFFDVMRHMWNRANWRQKIRALSITAVATPIALIAFPFVSIGVGVLVFKSRILRALQDEPEIDASCLDYASTMKRFVKLAGEFELDSVEKEKSNRISDKYNQPTPAFAHVFRKY